MIKKRLGIYIHIPFCKKKCLYCDFLSYTESDEQKKQYTEALLWEIGQKAKAYQDVIADTVFIGGGTPSILSVFSIHAILQALHENFHMSDETEYSIECNPGTAAKEKLAEYRKAGLNRISFGLQSTHIAELEALGRIHTYEDFTRCYKWAREAGFDNINIDVMTGIPRQTPVGLTKSLERVLALQPEHISAYHLILEPGTPLFETYRNHPVMSDEQNNELYQTAKAQLIQAGYNRYEISNYAKPGYKCRHNLKYWSGEEYAGFGLGASSLFQNTRWKNTDDFTLYVNHTLTECEKEILSKENQIEEYVIFGLRKMDGISFADFKERFGIEMYELFREPIDKYKKLNLVNTDGERLAFTDRGIDVSNAILADFLF